MSSEKHFFCCFFPTPFLLFASNPIPQSSFLFLPAKCFSMKWLYLSSDDNVYFKMALRKQFPLTPLISLKKLQKFHGELPSSLNVDVVMTTADKSLIHWCFSVLMRGQSCSQQRAFLCIKATAFCKGHKGQSFWLSTVSALSFCVCRISHWGIKNAKIQ